MKGQKVLPRLVQSTLFQPFLNPLICLFRVKLEWMDQYAETVSTVQRGLKETADFQETPVKTLFSLLH